MRKIHLICNAHIDPVWQWEWEEGISAALSSFQSAVNLMEKHDYVFNHNEACLYQAVKEYSPSLYSSIQEKVKEGKWSIMGGWYLQPDCMLPCGEAFIRQIQNGKIFFQKELGSWPKTAINFDPFGHSRGLVQILSKCGQSNYLFMRPLPNQLALEDDIFLWEGYDGSRVKAARMPTCYNSSMGQAAGKIAYQVDQVDTKHEVSFCCWGVGNHGGGPSDKDLSDIEELQRQRAGQMEIVHSTPDAFFEEVNPAHVYSKSLIPCMAGCYSSMAGFKQKYRELERTLFLTESWAAFASLEDKLAYPEKELKEVEKDMMDLEFHDVLPGSMVKVAEEDSFRKAGHGLEVLNRIRAKIFYANLRGEAPAKAGTFPLFVMNSSAHEGEQIVEADLSLVLDPTPQWWESRIVVYDEEGHRLPSQNVKESSNISLNWRKRVAFRANLKPFGFQRFTAVVEKGEEPHFPLGQDIHFDNGELDVSISAKTGWIENLSVRGQKIGNGPLFVPLSFDDIEDPWGMDSPYVGSNPRPFVFSSHPNGLFQGLNGLEVIEDGEIYLRAEAFFRDENTQLRMVYTLPKKGSEIQVEAILFPGDAPRCYKLGLPLGEGKLIGEQVFGSEALFEDGKENASHDFLALEKTNQEPVWIATPNTYASSFQNGQLNLTLMRTATYCAHPFPGRPLVREGRSNEKIDMGERRFRFALDLAKEKEWKEKANRFACPSYVLNAFPTKEERIGKKVEFHLEKEALFVAAFKKAEQGSRYILRIQNPTSLPQKGKVKLGQAEKALSFLPFEVKTLSYQEDSGWKELSEMEI